MKEESKKNTSSSFNQGFFKREAIKVLMRIVEKVMWLIAMNLLKGG